MFALILLDVLAKRSFTKGRDEIKARGINETRRKHKFGLPPGAHLLKGQKQELILRAFLRDAHEIWQARTLHLMMSQG